MCTTKLMHVRIPVGPLDQFHLLYAIVTLFTVICAFSACLLSGKVSEPTPAS
ncbi:MAG: hypothetical protein ACYDBB_16970 [Armatimonadota bacterium]